MNPGDVIRSSWGGCPKIGIFIGLDQAENVHVTCWWERPETAESWLTRIQRVAGWLEDRRTAVNRLN